MTVTFDIPYFFDAEYVPRGKRKPLEAMFGGTIPVEFESLSSEEAPIAVTVTRNDSFSSVTRDFVAFEGSFYNPHKGSFWRGQDEVVTVHEFTPKHIGHHADRALGRYNAGQVPELPPEEGSFYTVGGRHNSDHWNDVIEDAKEEVRRSAANVIFVDGVLHYKCELPTILSSISYRMGTRDVVQVDLGKSDENTGAHGAMFTISELASAMAWARDRQAREPESVLYEYVTVDVHQPHLLPVTDVTSSEAVRLCSFLFERIDKLEKKSDAYLMDFMAARRALKAARAEATEETVSAMLDAWEDLYRNEAPREEARCRGFGSSYRLDDDIYFKALMGMRAAWEDRPVLDHVEHATQSTPVLR